jgi:hypothetical protein
MPSARYDLQPRFNLHTKGDRPFSESSENNPTEMPMFFIAGKQLLFHKVRSGEFTHDFTPMLIRNV